MSGERLVEVEWVDSAVLEGGSWLDRHQLLENATRERITCRTVAYLLAQTDEALVLVQSVGGFEGQVQGGIVVPRSAVRALTNLTRPAD